MTKLGVRWLAWVAVVWFAAIGAEAQYAHTRGVEIVDGAGRPRLDQHLGGLGEMKRIVTDVYSAMRFKNAAKCKSDSPVAASAHNSALLCGVSPRRRGYCTSPYATPRRGTWRTGTKWDRPLL